MKEIGTGARVPSAPPLDPDTRDIYPQKGPGTRDTYSPPPAPSPVSPLPVFGEKVIFSVVSVCRSGHSGASHVVVSP